MADARIAGVQRFATDWVCGPCNSLDSVDGASRPGAWFSLTVEEMRAVRRIAGTRANRGVQARSALRLVRAAALSDYRRRLPRAALLARTLAEEFGFAMDRDRPPRPLRRADGARADLPRWRPAAADANPAPL